MPRAWVFNLDAEDELARYPLPYARTVSMEAIIRKRVPVALLGPGDIVLDEVPVEADGYEGAAWCPTPFAQGAWRRAGLPSRIVPSPEILRRVNHRQFALSFSDPCLESQFIENAASWEDWLRMHHCGNWLLKRPFGYVGRGQRKIAWPLSLQDRAWVDASLRADGFLIERFVHIVKELALHGWIEGEKCSWGTLTEQAVDEHRVWLGSRTIDDAPMQSRIRDACEPLATALVVAGYFGPFGVDAYLWKDDRGQLQCNAVSELNARYTMGYAVGMGALTPRP